MGVLTRSSSSSSSSVAAFSCTLCTPYVCKYYAHLRCGDITSNWHKIGLFSLNRTYPIQYSVLCRLRRSTPDQMAQAQPPLRPDEDNVTTVVLI
jgi:hypothetical protein